MTAATLTAPADQRTGDKAPALPPAALPGMAVHHAHRGAAADSDLSAAERDTMQTLPLRRRLEWREGRLAAKRALGELLDDRPGRFEVLAGPEGAPLALGPGTAKVRLSITHTRRHVAAVCARLPVGIDVCDLDDADRVLRALRLACQPDELARLGELDERRLATLWALKEAALKATGGRLFSPGPAAHPLARLDPPQFVQPGLWARVTHLPDAVLAVVLDVRSGTP